MAKISIHHPSIVTKGGDKGITSLCYGRRVNKDHIRIESCGALDELGAYLSLSKSLIKNKKAENVIESVQRDLFVIGREVVSESRFLNKLPKRIDNSCIERLEKIIKELEKKNGRKKGCFYLFGQNLLSSTLNVARTVARRAERRIVTLQKRKFLNNSHILTYINRLSDLLYLLAKSESTKRT